MTKHPRPCRLPLGTLMLLAAMLMPLPAVSQDVIAPPQMDWQPPAFTVTGPEGDDFRYPGDLARPTVMFFWATWCPYCKALMPHLQSILEEFPGQVDVVALTIREDGDPAAVLAEYGYDFRLVEDADEAAAAWGVKGTPGLFLADPDGRVVFDRMRIPPEADPQYETGGADIKHYQKAARGAPYWAASLRQALDPLLEQELQSD